MPSVILERYLSFAYELALLQPIFEYREKLRLDIAVTPDKLSYCRSAFLAFDFAILFS
jgi:hypothetical protein